MLKVLYIAVGGAAGSVLRFLLQGWLQRASGSVFPVGTLVVNVLGCLVIGVLAAAFAGAAAGVREEYHLGLTVGLLGGFTTFSTFGLETYLLASPGQYRHAGAYIALSVILGLVAVWLGYRAGERWWGA
jgi:CrcB protein